MPVLKCRKCNNAVSAGTRHQCRQMQDAGISPIVVSNHGHSDLFVLVAMTAILNAQNDHGSGSPDVSFSDSGGSSDGGGGSGGE